ncbi:MAG: hypothetical protein HUK08_00355 [Bacteroidaceae bacterium]|nr:hypothetical protein [Bacteroidaceae bacterium]
MAKKNDDANIVKCLCCKNASLSVKPEQLPVVLSKCRITGETEVANSVRRCRDFEQNYAAPVISITRR